MNILELLKKYAKKGDVFYSLLHGECTLTAFRNLTRHKIGPTITMENSQGLNLSFYEDGTFYEGMGECVIFPSKGQRDWKKWAEEKRTKGKNLYQVGDHVLYGSGDLGVVVQADSNRFTVNFGRGSSPIMYDQDKSPNFKKIDHFDYSYLKPKDYLLIRDRKEEWTLAQFSHISKCGFIVALNAINCMTKEVIPYNIETQRLLGTTDDCPEFYK